MELLERILVMSILVRYHVTITSISLQWALAESRNDLSFSNVKSVPGGLADPISIVLYGVLFVFHSFHSFSLLTESLDYGVTPIYLGYGSFLLLFVLLTNDM